MKRAICIGMGLAVVLLVFGGVTLEDKFQVWKWNGQYYARMKMPDGAMAELKDPNDLTYLQWKARFLKHWQDSQNPPEPNYPVLFDNAVYSILEKDVNDLILHWKPDEQKIEITPVKLKALNIAVVQMSGVFGP